MPRGIVAVAAEIQIGHNLPMLRLMTLCFALAASPLSFAEVVHRPPPPPPPAIRDPVPGPFFVYFHEGTAELEAPSLEYLRTIADYWNDGDGATVVCSASPYAGSPRDLVRWRQFERLRTELNALGIRALFWTTVSCPSLGREVPEGFATFVLYGIARL